MKILSPRIHGYLDYVVVFVFLLAPTLFGLAGLPAIIAYALAGIHLALTLITAFPLGAVHIVPLRLHGFIELIVSIVLVVLPWLLQFADVLAARNFYVGMGVLIFFTWLVTAYSAEQPVGKPL